MLNINFSFVHGHFLEYYFLIVLIFDIIDSQRTAQNEECILEYKEFCNIIYICFIAMFEYFYRNIDRRMTRAESKRMFLSFVINYVLCNYYMSFMIWIKVLCYIIGSLIFFCLYCFIFTEPHYYLLNLEEFHLNVN